MEPHLNGNGLTDRQRESVAAASEVFDRVMAGYGGAAPEHNGDHPYASRVRLTQLRSAAARTFDLYGELFQRAFETYADLAQSALRPGTDPAPETALAVTGRARGEALQTLWIHNLTELAVTGVDLRLTDLTAASGAGVGGGTAVFSPARIDVGAGAAAAVQLRVPIPAATAPGAYHGHVLSRALPGAALAVRLTVLP